MYQAHHACSKGLKHFPLLPKLHFLHEVAFEMKRQAGIASYTFNPAVHSCALDEDAIGRAAAVTRCVSPKLISLRTLQRYLAYIQIAWARS